MGEERQGGREERGEEEREGGREGGEGVRREREGGREERGQEREGGRERDNMNKHAVTLTCVMIVLGTIKILQKLWQVEKFWD